MNGTYPIAVRAQSVTVVIAMMLCFFVPHTLNAQTELLYQNRGNWSEGLKPKPVSGYDIELLSAVVSYEEPFDELPASLKIKFYLDREQDVYLIVRETDNRYFYWLDQVTPTTAWKPGFSNFFEWPTKTVLKLLNKQLSVYDLGVVARLGKSNPSLNERVAPAILFHSRLPATIQGYRFSFKTGGDARLSGKIFLEGNEEPVKTQMFRRVRGGRPFAIEWDAPEAKAGLYTVVISGFFLSTNQPIKQKVQFHHVPRIVTK